MRWDSIRAVTSSEYREHCQKWLKSHKIDPSLVPSDGYVREIKGTDTLLVQVYIQNPDHPAGILYDFDEDKPKTDEVIIRAVMPEHLLEPEEE